MICQHANNYSGRNLFIGVESTWVHRFLSSDLNSKFVKDLIKEVLQLRRSLAACNETEAGAVVKIGELGTVTFHWQIGALVLVAWIVCEHICRPIWEEWQKTPFPIDRYHFAVVNLTCLVPLYLYTFICPVFGPF
jgi:hypothetical protein